MPSPPPNDEEQRRIALGWDVWNTLCGPVLRESAVLDLIAAGADPNTQSYRGGATSLMLAANDARAQNIVSALIAAGADVNKENKDGQTALFYAAVNGYAEHARLLLEAGAVLSSDDNVIDLARDLMKVRAHDSIARMIDEAEKSRKSADFEKSLEVFHKGTDSPVRVMRPLKISPKNS